MKTADFWQFWVVSDVFDAYGSTVFRGVSQGFHCGYQAQSLCRHRLVAVPQRRPYATHRPDRVPYLVRMEFTHAQLHEEAHCGPSALCRGITFIRFDQMKLIRDS